MFILKLGSRAIQYNNIHTTNIPFQLLVTYNEYSYQETQTIISESNTITITHGCTTFLLLFYKRHNFLSFCLSIHINSLVFIISWQYLFGQYEENKYILGTQYQNHSTIFQNRHADILQWSFVCLS